MAKRATPKKKRTTRRTAATATATKRRWGRIAWMAALGVAGLVLAWIALYSVVAPPTTPYMLAERSRHGGISREWVPMERIAPVMARSVVAAEDANFCLHWGFDMNAIRDALEDGGNRGASTISQQTVKNVFLWHGRSWPRKALEAVLTPVAELIWTKRRMLEIYLNVAEFDRGVFGVEAAAKHYFGTTAEKLTARQAGLLAAILPDPKGRSAGAPSDFVSRRAGQIADGAATIRADGRAGCFED